MSATYALELQHQAIRNHTADQISIALDRIQKTFLNS